MATETITLDKVYEELRLLREQMVRREDVEALIDTPLLRANPPTMRQLAASAADKKAGRVSPVRGVKDLLR